MAERSFTEYVAQRFDDEFWQACENWVARNKYSIDISETRIHRVGEVGVENIQVKTVWVNSLPGMKIAFEVAIEVEVAVKEANYRYDNEESVPIWLLVGCQGDLDVDLDDFKIISTKEYDGKSKVSNPMSDALVPIIYKNDMDNVAEDFLRRYYPKALLEPVEVDPYELAANMGLKVRMEYITKDGSVFGRTYFSDCDIDLYNPNTGEIYKDTVEAGTIIVDKQAYFLYAVGQQHNTVVHECVHWDKHKKAIALARLYNKSLTSIGCKVVGGVTNGERDSLAWMEWQANSLAPKIQMPKEMFKKYVDSLISKYRREYGKYDIIDLIEPIIRDISLKYGVSNTAAKIRLLEIGRTEAQGAFIYVDGKHIPPHKSGNTEININQTYSIGAKDAAILAMTDNRLRETLSRGKYQYIESHYVLNHPMYIEKVDGETRLTHYARNHMDECCLLFDLSVTSQVSDRYHSECYLNREKTANIDFNITFKEEDNLQSQKNPKFMTEYMEWSMSIYNELKTDYMKSLEAVMKKTGVTAAEIERRTGLSAKTVTRVLSGETCKLETMVTICLALQVPYFITEYIMNQSPVSLTMSVHNHQWYRFALEHMYTKDFEEIQRFFDEQGADRL